VGRLQELTRDNPVQQQNAAELSVLVSDSANFADSNGRNTLSTERSRAALLGEIRAEEDGLLRTRVRQQTDATNRAALRIFTLCRPSTFKLNHDAYSSERISPIRIG
jgi:hypothetical protein